MNFTQHRLTKYAVKISIVSVILQEIRRRRTRKIAIQATTYIHPDTTNNNDVRTCLTTIALFHFISIR
jgi:hypothetical protein